MTALDQGIQGEWHTGLGQLAQTYRNLFRGDLQQWLEAKLNCE